MVIFHRFLYVYQRVPSQKIQASVPIILWEIKKRPEGEPAKFFVAFFQNVYHGKYGVGWVYMCIYIST